VIEVVLRVMPISRSRKRRIPKVREVEMLFQFGQLSMRIVEIARRHGVSPTTVTSILRRQLFKPNRPWSPMQVKKSVLGLRGFLQ
jgi:transposase-like protein